MSEHHRTPAWRKIQREYRPVIKAQLPMRCIQPRCQRGGTVRPDDPFDVGHRVDAAKAKAMGWAEHEINAPENLGPAHRGCNRSDGGRAGAAKTNARRERVERAVRWYPKW
jgi:hypothetical protein